MKCKCRNCSSIYDEHKSLAEWKGFCSMRCQHEKAKALGYKKTLANERSCVIPTSEYMILKKASEIGSVFV